MIVVKNAAGQFLLLKRGAHKHHPNAWENPGGHVEDDETFEQAARRELLEEVGITTDSLTRLYDKNYFDDERRTNYHVVIFEAIVSDTPTLNEPETFTDMKWVDKTDIGRYNLAPYVRDDFKELGIL